MVPKKNNMMLLQKVQYCLLLVMVRSIVFLLVKIPLSYRRLSTTIMVAQRMWPMKDIMFSLISLIALSNLIMKIVHQCNHY
jgi:hypothetical protein